MNRFKRMITMLSISIVSSYYLVSCGDSTERKVTTNLQELFGRKVMVDSLNWARTWSIDTKGFTDTTYAPLSDTGRVKVLAYYNAKGCTPCRLKELYQWNETKMQFDSISRLAGGSEVELVLIFGPANDKSKLLEVETSLRMNQIRFPILIDTLGVFERSNLLPSDEIYHYFLLDRHNKIAVVGSPINNSKIRELYLEQIVEVAIGR